MNQTPSAAFVLKVAVMFDPNDPAGRERLAAASRNLARSWGLQVVNVDELPVDQLPPLEPGRRRGDEALGGSPGQPMVIGERLESGLTATQESRLAAKVAKAQRKAKVTP